jgi:hypothetical protein
LLHTGRHSRFNKAWIATWNDNPRPFTWTKTADEILASLGDYLAKIGTGQSLNRQDCASHARQSAMVLAKKVFASHTGLRPENVHVMLVVHHA